MVGTRKGGLVFSRDNGDHWQLLANFLPPVLSIEAAVID